MHRHEIGRRHRTHLDGEGAAEDGRHAAHHILHAPGFHHERGARPPATRADPSQEGKKGGRPLAELDDARLRAALVRYNPKP